MNRMFADSRGKSVITPTRCAVAVSICLLIIMSSQVVFSKPGPRRHAAKAGRSTRVSRADLIERYSLNRPVRNVNGARMRANLQTVLARPDVKRFLAVIRKAEGGEPNIMVGGCRARTLRQHPATTLPKRCRYRIKLRGRWTFSTASGNFQLTYSNWQRIAPLLGLRSFSENNQALAALELIRRGGGAAESRTSRGISLKRRIQTGFMILLQGDVKEALCLATYDWASSRCSSLPASYKIDYARLLNSIPARKFDDRGSKKRVRR